jgi:hypothetical protein
MHVSLRTSKLTSDFPPKTQPSHRDHSVLTRLLTSTPFSPLVPTSSSPPPITVLPSDFRLYRPSKAQAVSRRSSTAEARVRSQFSPCAICGGQSGTGQVFFFSRISFFPCHHSTNVPHVLLVPEGQMVEALEPSIKQRCFGNRGAVDKVLYL